MNKYKVEITEYLQRVIEVDAESEEDAIALVKEDYRKENIVLDDFDLTGLDIEIYNPRREHWNTNPTKEEMEKQIKWEQNHLDAAHIIAMVLLDDSKSPISLLELGLYANTNKLIVFCTPNFYRWDNVRLK